MVKERKENCKLTEGIVSISWSQRQFALIVALPKRQTIDSLYFSQINLTSLHMKCPSPATGKRILIHIGGAAPSINSDIRLSGIIQFSDLLHPLFSPDLTQSSVYRFRAVKGKMAKPEFGSTAELGSEVTDITGFISHWLTSSANWDRGCRSVLI
jgi:hypothetical protein